MENNSVVWYAVLKTAQYIFGEVLCHNERIFESLMKHFKPNH